MLKRNKAGQYLVGLFISLAFTQCGNHEGNKQKMNTGIKGRFINQTFLQQVPDSIAGTIQAYCYEMNFISSDSVIINYGFEEGKLAYKQEGDHYRLVGSIPFSLNNEGSITLSDSTWFARGDTAWTGSPLNSKFIKVPDIKGQEWVFDQYLNERIIVGTYQLFKGNKRMDKQVIFNKDGSVSGLDNYTSYSICYSGDCTGETEPASDQVTFKASTGTAITYAIKIDKKRTISFYTIGPTLKDNDGNDQKGGRVIKGKVFELRYQ